MSQTTFFAALLDAEKIPPNVQLHLFQQASRQKDTTTLAALASHLDLSDEVDALLAEDSTAVVRIAWMARPGRTADQASPLLEREKRLGVTAAAMGVPGLPDELYHQAVERNAPAISTALLEASNGPLEARCRAAKLLAAKGDSFTFKWPWVLETFAQQPRVASALVTPKSSNDLLRLTSRLALTPEARAKSVELALSRLRANPDALGRNYHLPYALSGLGEALENAARADLDSDLRRTLDDAATMFLGSEVFRPTHHNAREVQALLAQPRAMASLHEVEASASADTDTVSGLLQRYSASLNPSLFLAALNNPAVTVPTLRAAFKNGTPLVDAAAKRARTVAAVVAIALGSPHFLNDGFLEQSGNPEEALALILSHPDAHGAALRSKYFSLAAATSMPATTLLKPGSPPEVTNLVASLLGENLTSPDDWEIVESVAENFEGSFQDLLDVVTLVQRTAS